MMAVSRKKKNEKESESYKMFANYGHDCTLEPGDDSCLFHAHDYDTIFAPGDSLSAKFRRWMIRLIVVSESSKFYTHHLRSFGAITKERRRQLKNYPCTIHPFSTGRIVWAIIMIVAILYQLLVTPFHYLLFDFDEKFEISIYYKAVRIFFHFMLIVNIFINALTGYYDEPMQQVVLDKNKIFV